MASKYMVYFKADVNKISASNIVFNRHSLESSSGWLRSAVMYFSNSVHFNYMQMNELNVMGRENEVESF